MLLLNKADLLTREQRRAWAEHFQKEGIRAVFWSALAEAQRLDAEEKVRTSLHVYREGKVSILMLYISASKNFVYKQCWTNCMNRS